jgi:hypothetical protein
VPRKFCSIAAPKEEGGKGGGGFFLKMKGYFPRRKAGSPCLVPYISQGNHGQTRLVLSTTYPKIYWSKADTMPKSSPSEKK